MLSLINAISFVVSLHNFPSSEKNAKGDFHIHPYIKEAEEEDIRKIGQMFSCWVSHNPLFSQWCLSYKENFLFDDVSLSNFTKEKPLIQKGEREDPNKKTKVQK